MTGFVRDDLEVKFLILYIAARLVEPVSFAALQELAMCDEGVEYFTFTSCLADLVRTGHLSVNQEGDYAITDKGRANSAICESGLAYSVRQRAESSVSAYNQKLRRAALVTAEVTPRPQGGYTLTMSLSDEEENVMRLELLITKEETALSLQKRFREQGEKLYSRVIRALFDPTD